MYFCFFCENLFSVLCFYFFCVLTHRRWQIGVEDAAHEQPHPVKCCALSASVDGDGAFWALCLVTIWGWIRLVLVMMVMALVMVVMTVDDCCVGHGGFDGDGGGDGDGVEEDGDGDVDDGDGGDDDEML